MMKLKTLALATSIALTAMSAAGTAQAGALATSVLDLSKFTLSHAGSATPLDASNFTLLTPANTADISTSLNGANLSNGISGVGQDLDLAPLRLGNLAVPVYNNNDYTVGPGFVSPPTSTYTLADQSQFGSPISGLKDPNTGLPVGTPGTASHAAYASITDQGDGSSAANNGLNAAFIFALGQGGALDIKFDARAYLEAFTTPGDAFPTAASAAYGLSFTIEDLVSGASIVTWKPDGINNNSVGLTSETDPFNLNDLISRNAPINGSTFRGAGAGTAFSGAWSATTVALLANHDYQLTIRSTAEADARKVPEPATLALMGLGLLGLGLSRRRRA